MSRESAINSEWLGLQSAADVLGVHPTTLRRWADIGEIPTMVTPGGHRRFALSDLERFADERRHERIVAGIEQVLAERILTQTREEIDKHRGEQWMSMYDEREREHKRLLGRRLVDILLKYISLREGGEDLLDAARVIGREHAENSLKLNQPLAETLRIVLFFRDMIFEVALHLPEVANVKVAANAQLLQRIGALLNAVELAVVETYDRARPASMSNMAG
jgi:excisionase family DNA binding protein